MWTCHLSCGCDGEDKGGNSGTAEVKETPLEKQQKNIIIIYTKAKTQKHRFCCWEIVGSTQRLM